MLIATYGAYFMPKVSGAPRMKNAANAADTSFLSVAKVPPVAAPIADAYVRTLAKSALRSAM